MRFGIQILMVLLFISCVRSQEKIKYRLVDGPCEGCEAVFEYGKEVLNAVDTLPEFNTAKEKLKISGTIYKPDGKTPAKNVILYIYHTNAKGIYPTRGDEKNWAKRHGFLRGWIKTGSDGKYTFYTQVPSSYPSRNTPAHIHPLILEPDGRYYYIDEYLFKGDPLLGEEAKKKAPRGGNGLVNLSFENGIKIARRDIILGENIPDYSK